MDRFTDSELHMARYYGIDTTGLSREEFEVQITAARGRDVVIASRGREYRKMAQIARQLGMPEPQGSVEARRYAIELRLHEIFQAKGIKKDAVILYADDSPNNPGRKAVVISTGIFWNQGMPYIMLYMEGARGNHGYYAHDAALFASVIE